MAAVKPSFEAEDSRMNREAEEGSTAVKFTTVNGNKSAASPSQNTPFRPDPSALSDPHRQHAQQSRQAPPAERKHKPLFVDSEESRNAYHDEPSTRSPEDRSGRIGKRKRSVEGFINVSPDFNSPPTRRDEAFRPPTELRSPARSLPPLLQFRESEPQHVPDHVPDWRQPRPSPSQTELQMEDAMRRDSHMHQIRNDAHDGSDSPQQETDMLSDQESEMQNDSLSGRKGPAQRRRFSQRTKTGCHTCRRRKKKCDEAKPHCQNCTRGGFPCEGYGPKHELNVKLPSKTIPLQAKSVEEHTFPGHRQSMPGAAAEHWLEAQRRFSYDSRAQPLSDGLRYAPANGPRPTALPEHGSPFPADRFTRPPHPEKARVPPPSSRFGLSTPSIINDINGGSMGHSSGGGSTSLGSAFDTPRAVLANRLTMNPPLGAYPSSGPSEKENMLNGRDYRHFTDPELLNDRAWCRQAIERYNKASKPSFDIDMDGRMRLFRQIIQPDRLLQPNDPRNHPVGTIGSKVLIEAPFKCEYGYNIHIADNVVIQSGCVMYDPCPITVGRGTIVGPNVKFYGLGPDLRLDARVRNGSEGKLRGGKILIEEDCYIGGDVIILPNVIIGRECVVEPGTVVSGNVQPGKVVAGNPMRIIRNVVPIPTQEEEYNRAEPVMLGNIWPAEQRTYNRDGRMGM